MHELIFLIGGDVATIVMSIELVYVRTIVHVADQPLSAGMVGVTSVAKLQIKLPLLLHNDHEITPCSHLHGHMPVTSRNCQT